MASLYKRGRVWYSSIYIDGKPVRKPLSTDKRIAEERLADMVKDRSAKKYGHAPQDVSWPDFRSRYMAYSKGSKAEKTAVRDESALVALEGFFMPSKLSQITPEALERWKGARKAAGKGNATINRDLNAVKAMLRKAVSWGYLKGFNGASVSRLRETRQKLLFYTPQELSRLIAKCKTEYPEKSSNAVPHDWVTICLLGARAGLRRSEIHWLAWDDIDFKRGLLSVTPKPGWDPKDYEVRHVPMTKDLASHLRGLPRATEWVLGNRPNLGVMTSYFRRIVRKAGLRGGIHTLRHTFASHLAQAGVSLYAIAKLLGHSDVRTTEIYAHLSPDTFQDAIKRLPKVVFGFVFVLSHFRTF